jgi:hypothetical protein
MHLSLETEMPHDRMPWPLNPRAFRGRFKDGSRKRSMYSKDPIDVHYG